MKVLSIYLAAALTLIAPPAFAGGLIVDGGFDAGSGSSFESPWQTISFNPTAADSLMRLQGKDYVNCCGASGSPSAEANFFAAFGVGGNSNEIILLQNFSADPGQYGLSFDGGSFNKAQAITFGIFDYAMNSYAYQNVFLPSATTDLDTIFQPFSDSNISLSGGIYALVFSNLGSDTDQADAFVDNVSLGAVPEPETWALMILGFGAVGRALRRKNMVPDKARLV